MVGGDELSEESALHFNVMLGGGRGADGFRQYTQRVQLAERLGFDGVWGGQGGRGPDTLTLLAHVVSVSSLRVGTSVILLPLHDPTDLARQVATLDQLSGGRFLFGVAAGGDRPPDFTIHGIDPKVRGRRTDEALTVMRALWSGQEVHHKGRFFQVDGQLECLPHQSPMPVLIGGRGGVSPVQRRIYERVVQHGQGWLPYIMAPEIYAKGQQAIRDLGGSSDLLYAYVAHVYVGTGDGSNAIEYAVERKAADYGRAGAPAGAAVERLRRLVVAGNSRDCADRLNQYVDLGVTEIAFNWASPPGEEEEQMRRLSEEVIPLVKAHVAMRLHDGVVDAKR